ncbi:ATP-binding protein [Helicobacter suis]|uniref:ATP-binding protein n=1 Tax=Helicobacter suis TaxID=104628 RepID=UPI001F07D7C1|nr:ATP-binding protein [Helicobacter suis]
MQNLPLLANILETSFTQASQRQLKPRDYDIKPSTLLYGGAKVGKSALALFIAKNYKKPIFIDATDWRLPLDALFKFLPSFAQDYGTDLLILKHPPKDFPLLTLPTLLIQRDTSHTPEGFKQQAIFPLSFSEFVHFCNKEPSALLARFLKEGNLPEMLAFCPHEKMLKKQALFALEFGAQTPLFKAILPFQAKSLSTNHLYTQLKKQLKISKDTLYRFLAYLQASQMLLSIPTEKGYPKLYFYDFSLPYTFSYSHPLPPVFENMVALELVRFFGLSALTSLSSVLRIQTNQRAYCFLPLAFPTQEQLEYSLPLLLKKIPADPLFCISLNPLPFCCKLPCTLCDFLTFSLKVLPTL